jgi:hypothetical protein
MDTLVQVIGDDPVPSTRLQPTVPRDLETIALKCLHKAPGKRYPSSAALADDLRAFLDGRPVQARPAGPGRAVKWARRRPVAAALLATIAVAVGVLLAGAVKYSRDMAAGQEQLRGQLEESRRSLYALQLTLAGTLWERDPGRGQVLLEDETRCPADLRDFTWGYWHRVCRRARRVPLAPGRPEGAGARAALLAGQAGTSALLALAALGLLRWVSWGATLWWLVLVCNSMLAVGPVRRALGRRVVFLAPPQVIEQGAVLRELWRRVGDHPAHFLNLVKCASAWCELGDHEEAGRPGAAPGRSPRLPASAGPGVAGPLPAGAGGTFPPAGPFPPRGHSAHPRLTATGAVE